LEDAGGQVGRRSQVEDLGGLPVGGDGNGFVGRGVWGGDSEIAPEELRGGEAFSGAVERDDIPGAGRGGESDRTRPECRGGELDGSVSRNATYRPLATPNGLIGVLSTHEDKALARWKPRASLSRRVRAGGAFSIRTHGGVGLFAPW
jgi:hypothetical protein